ncbi:hypothetical protein L6164_005346 [Bauhinia variegata]|uniref:Uncharacterized protein n=1 Tax=Bauhinia variegata TaxID=167791 RepID=A0ACB9PSX3_BAUVA|nr:hypothetical protein L6164_005346 [Bauhinia variegata]
MPKLVNFLLALSLDLFMKSRAIDTTSSIVCFASYCGGVLIRYPFWQQGNTTSAGKSCGYTGFGLAYSDDGRPPILTLSSDTYYFKEINYTNNTLTLIDTDVANQTCPRASHNVTIGDLPLSYRKLVKNLTFYFNCTAYPSALSHIQCLNNSKGKRSYVFEEGDEASDFDWSMNCEDKVVVTVNENEINGASLSTGFGVAMNKGFVLNWETATPCAKCEISGGNCGFDRVNNVQTLCYCIDGSIITDGTKSCKGMLT